jgi:hypothetical protein
MQVPVFRRLSFTIVPLLSIFVLVTRLLYYSSASAKTKKGDHISAYKVYQKKCLLCHDSIADPEKPGRTKDDWRLVVEIMHGYGLGLTQQETDLIIELLYDLRKGIEKEAG